MILRTVDVRALGTIIRRMRGKVRPYFARIGAFVAGKRVHVSVHGRVS